MIVSTNETCWGAPRLEGRRLTVADVVLGIYYSDNIKDYTLDFEISHDEAILALKYCAQQKCKTKALNYCDKCLLRFVKDLGQDDNNTIKEITHEDGTATTIINDQHFYLGSKEEYEQAQMGELVWVKAEEVLNKYL